MPRKKLFRILAVAVALAATTAVSARASLQYLDNWYFIAESKQNSGIHLLKAEVPGVVHLDIMHHYPPEFDFYRGDNETSELAKWIESENWIYYSVFDFSPISERTELVFEGLDTYANVYLNDSLVLTADNMFRTWVIDVSGILNDGENQLKVHFISPLNYHRETVKNAGYKLPSGNETGPLQVSCYTRKAAYQFGWDFGPRFVTCGIWRPCYLRSAGQVEISDFFAETKSISNGDALMEFHFTLRSDSAYTTPFKVEMMSHSFELFINEGEQDIKFYHEIKDAKLWYPNGHGDHPVYASTLNIINSKGENAVQENVNFGVRTIELVNEPDSIGTSFYFKVNGKPIFAKGANYIPQDLFLPRVTDEQTDHLLQSVVAMNMNMIRVWGGGIYESDYFYERCDRYGIMVWQDFMFANSMYPSDSAFHENVAHEIEDNVKRLRNHPCIAIWCGNNEIDVAWHNWGWQKQFGYSASDSAEIRDNYLYIFEEIIPGKLKELDPARAYIPSSPQSNWGKKENFNHGAMHYWGVWHGREPIDSFKTNVGRFMVEYGFQSYPYTSQEDEERFRLFEITQTDSAALRKRQKSYIGDGLIEAEILNYFGRLNFFPDWVLASQFIQGKALQTAIESHRMHAPHCMGSLVWQLNDCWPGPSWSIINYRGIPKLGFDDVRRGFSPIIAVPDTSDNKLSFTVVSDMPFAGTLVVLTYSSRGLRMIDGLEFEFSVNALEPKKIVLLKWSKYLKKMKYGPDYIYTILDKSGKAYYTNRVTFQNLEIDEIY